MGKTTLSKKQRKFYERKPEEIFAPNKGFVTDAILGSPFYGMGKAEYLIRHFDALVKNGKIAPEEKFRILFCGMGTATMEKDILDFIRDKRPDLYSRLQAVGVELSKKLAESQKEELKEHRGVFKLVRGDATKLKFNENSFHAHVSNELLDDLEVERVVRIGGKLYRIEVDKEDREFAVPADKKTENYLYKCRTGKSCLSAFKWINWTF
jgi:SAM-dependent MidA family methyltransferase